MILKYNNVTIDALNKNKGRNEKFVRLVEEITGEVKSGELLAIMGPSGCGKTTFMSALAARIQSGSKTSGNITLDEKQREIREWNKIIGFVDQDDHIYEQLTVFQTLEYAAKFLLKGSSRKNITAKIRELLAKFGLENVSYNKMHKLSGGERKRTMIALELITDPEIIFLDEPTSGLDTKTPLNIIKMLSDLSKKGKIVVLTIHQPSNEIYGLFDKLLLMAKSRMVYSGQAQTFEEFLLKKGVAKRDGISFPDFIAEMVVEERGYNEINSNAQIVNEMIDKNIEDNKKDLVKNKLKHNESYYDYTISPRDIIILTQRKFLADYANKTAFIKQFIKRSLILIMVFISITFLFNSQLTKTEIQLSLNQSSECASTKKFIFFIFQKANEFYINKVATVFVLLNSSSAFLNQTLIIKREIAVGSYSTASYFISIALNEIINELYIPIIGIISIGIINTQFITMHQAFSLILIPIVASPIGMVFGSLTANKRFSSFLSTIVSCFHILSPANISSLNDKWIKKFGLSSYKIGRIVFYLLPINPMYHFLGIIHYFSSIEYTNFARKDDFYAKFIKEWDATPNVVKSTIKIDPTKPSVFYMNTSATYLDFKLKTINISILFFVTYALFILFGLYRQASILMPKIRTRLEK